MGSDKNIIFDSYAFIYRHTILNFYIITNSNFSICLLYTSDAADERSSEDLDGRRIIKKKKQKKQRREKSIKKKT